MAWRNIETRVDSDRGVLVIEIDLSVDLGLSSSGKSRLVAAGTRTIKDAGLRLSVVGYRPIDGVDDLEAAANLPAA